MTPLETMQRNYQQRNLAAKAWKKKGGKVVGYFCDNVPEELILAAGLFPLRISGDPQGGTETIGEYWDEGLVFYREPFVASMLHKILTGKYDFLDYLVIPHARDSVHRLYTALLREKTSNPKRKLPELAYMDNLHTSFLRAGVYNQDRMLELKKKLEKWSGKKISQKALSKAIATTNESKELLKKVAVLRAAEPPRISGVEALQIIGSSMFMLKEDHNKLLKKYLEGAAKLPARKGARLFVESSPLDNLQLYEIIESCGATVVAEDNCWGNRYSDVPIDTTRNPLDAIIERYFKKSPCPRMYPLSKRVDYCAGGAAEAKAQGTIFNVIEWDDMLGYEIPDEMKALKENGIPSLFLKKQPYLISEPKPLKADIKKFIKAI